jgi:hypothetical protein
MKPVLSLIDDAPYVKEKQMEPGGCGLSGVLIEPDGLWSSTKLL